MSPLSAYLHPTAPIHANVLLPSDPAAALGLAQVLLEKPLMSNHSHGLWGYSGTTADGISLTIQSTGIGATSAAAVVDELAEHGAQRVVRLGSALGRGERDAGPALVERASGVGAGILAGGERVEPDPGLTAELRRELGPVPSITVRSQELPLVTASRHGLSAPQGEWDARDLETAAVLALAAHRGVAAAAALVVSEPGNADTPGEAADLTELALAAGRALARSA